MCVCVCRRCFYHPSDVIPLCLYTSLCVHLTPHIHHISQVLQEYREAKAQAKQQHQQHQTTNLKNRSSSSSLSGGGGLKLEGSSHGSHGAHGHGYGHHGRLKRNTSGGISGSAHSKNHTKLSNNGLSGSQHSQLENDKNGGKKIKKNLNKILRFSSNQAYLQVGRRIVAVNPVQVMLHTCKHGYQFLIRIHLQDIFLCCNVLAYWGRKDRVLSQHKEARMHASASSSSSSAASAQQNSPNNPPNDPNKGGAAGSEVTRSDALRMITDRLKLSAFSHDFHLRYMVTISLNDPSL